MQQASAAPKAAKAPKAKAAPKEPWEARVKLRKQTKKAIEANQPRNADGQMVSPNTGKPLKPGEVDVGHKPKQEWRVRKEMHKQQKSTRNQVIEAENNPDLYHLEPRGENRGHQFENKN